MLPNECCVLNKLVPYSFKQKALLVSDIVQAEKGDLLFCRLLCVGMTEKLTGIFKGGLNQQLD